jgi:hypothetical protein
MADSNRGPGYIPVVSDIMHMGKNIGSSVMHGYDMPADLANGNFRKALTPRATHIGSLGGVMSAFGGVGLGAAVGAAVGSQVGSDDPLDGAKAGAVVGGAAGLVAPFALGLSMKAGYEVGKAGLEVGANVVERAPAAMAGLAGVGAQVINGTAFGTGRLGNAINPVRRWAGAADKLGNSLFTVAEKKATQSTGLLAEAEKLTHVRPTPLGAVVLGGTAAIAGATSAFHEVQRSHMGQMDGQVTRATPKMQPTFDNGGSGGAYANNAGATGDLVFALNANRRG